MSFVTQTPLESADEVEAKAYEKIAEAHTELARARRMRTAPAAGDAWLLLTVAAAKLGIRVHVLRDAAARGELQLGQVGRRRCVRESALDRWIASSPAKLKAAANDTKAGPRAEARADVAAAAKRAAR